MGLVGTNLSLVVSSTFLTLTVLEHYPETGELISITVLVVASVVA